MGANCTARIASCLLQSWLPRMAPELPTGRAVKIQGCQRQTGSRESGIIDQKRKWKERDIKEETTLKKTAGNSKGCQDSKMSRASRVERKRHSQTRMSRKKEFREMTPQTAVTARQ